MTTVLVPAAAWASIVSRQILSSQRSFFDGAKPGSSSFLNKPQLDGTQSHIVLVPRWMRYDHMKSCSFLGFFTAVEAHPAAAKSPLAAAIFEKSLLLSSMIINSPCLLSVRPEFQRGCVERMIS